MKKAILFFILCVLLFSPFLARAENKIPEFGTCSVFSWQPDKVWFGWDQSPTWAVRFYVTFFLINTRTGEEILTGSDYPPTFIGDKALILFNGVDFLRGEWIIHDLTCIATFDTGNSVSVKNGGPWVMFHRYLPMVMK